MEIKYEPVFGDQALFYDAQSDCEMVGNGHHKIENGIVKVWNFTEKQWTNNYKQQVTIDAMRRIIRTPTWTVADQKAGKLPEVGMIGALKNGREIEYLGKSVGGTLHHVRFVDDGECIRISLFDFFPIESPEEKAARLRKEWCKEAAGVCSLGMTTLTRIYDAMLSGELSTPSKDGE